VDRVAAVEVNPKSTQGELQAAIYPVADRLVRQYRAARQRKLEANEKEDATASETANGEMEALMLFKWDILRFTNTYTFLSQVFDYGVSALEARFLFFKRL
jgi:type I restriction enzyme R subunit